MNRKQKQAVIIVYGVILVAFTLLFFIIPFTRTAAVWLAYIFAIISIVLGYAITAHAFDQKTSLTSKIYGLPVLRISYIYTITQLIFSLFVIVLDKFLKVLAWVPAATGILLIAAALIGTIGADQTRTILEQTDIKNREKIRQVKTFRLNIDSLASSCTDKDVKKLLEKLSEKLKYSDPVSAPALEEIESRIFKGMDEIREMLDGRKYDAVISKINAVDRLVDERNRMCKAEKGN